MGALAHAVPSRAQQPGNTIPPSTQPIPSDMELSKLVWTTMAAIDQANISGNYSVLRDLAAPGFQANNDAAQLAEIFAPVRATRIDLSNALLLAPTYTVPALMTQPGVMRVQGYFGLRPTAIGFDLSFQWVRGRWRLFGVSIRPSSIAAIQPPASPAPTRPPPPRR